MKLSDKDLYQLRKARLLIEKRTLAAQQAEQAYRELLLEIRNECGIIGQETISGNWPRWLRAVEQSPRTLDRTSVVIWKVTSHTSTVG